MESNEKSFKSFMLAKKDYFILLGTVFLCFMLMLVFNGCFPFGTKTLLVSDSNGQIAPFFEYLFKVFRGEANLFYTSLLGGGVEIFSTLEYMLLSPFFLICFLGGEAHCYEMFNFAIMFMLLFDAFIFVWFSKKYFKNIKLVYRIFIGLLFTFSGYTLLNYSFVTWLIFPALLLLLIDGFIILLKEKKILKFTLVLVWFVINCFSVGTFANLMLVIIFTLFGIFLIPKQDRKSVFARLFASYLIAVLACVIVLFPCIFVLSKGSRSAVSFDYLKYTEQPFVFYNFSGLFIDSLFLIFFVINLVLIYRKEKLSGKFKFNICVFCLLIFPMIFNFSLNLLCGGSYAGFSNRFHFLMSAFLCVNTMEFFNQPHEFQKVKSSLILKISYVFIVAIALLLLSVFLIFQLNALGRNVKNPMSRNYSLPLFFLLCGLIFFAILFFCWFFNKRKILSEKFLKINLILVMTISCLINILCFSAGGTVDTSAKREMITLTSNQNLQGKIKNFGVNDLIISNETKFGLQTTSFFSSLISDESVNSFSKLGYSSNVVHVSNDNGTLIADALTGQKYYITSREENRPYLTLVERSENYFLYENILSSSGAILIDENFVYNNEFSSIENLQKLAESYGIAENLFEEISVTVENLNDSFSDVKAVKKITFKVENDGILYFNFNSEKLSDDLSKDYDYENIYLIGDVTRVFYDFEFLHAGDEITFTGFYETDFADDKIRATFLNYENAKTFCEKMQENELAFSSNKDGYVVSGNVTAGKKLIVFSPDIEGLNYNLNGELISISHNFGHFAEIKTNEGEINLVVTYKCPYLKLWLIISFVAIVLIAIVSIIYHFTKFKHIEKVIFVGFVSLSCIILSIFYLFGVILTFFRNFL